MISCSSREYNLNTWLSKQNYDNTVHCSGFDRSFVQFTRWENQRDTDDGFMLTTCSWVFVSVGSKKHPFCDVTPKFFYIFLLLFAFSLLAVSQGGFFFVRSFWAGRYCDKTCSACPRHFERIFGVG